MLDEEPDGDTTINLSSSDTGTLTVSPSSIVFTKTGEQDTAAQKYQWDSAQNVTLTAVSDSDAGSERESVSHRVTVRGRSYIVGRVSAIIQDTGLPLLTYSPDTREVTIASEGGTATYTIELAEEPGADVAVTLSSSDEDSVTVSPSSITFTKTGEAADPDKYEWDDPQTVTVTGVADDDEFDGRAEIEHSTIFAGVRTTWSDVLVTVTDGNRAPFFNDGTSTTREIPENAGQGASVGSPVAATDLNTGDTLTYTLDDPSGLFEIDGNGQITVKTTDPPVSQPFDYEGSDQDYSMDIVVRDDAHLEDKIEVKVLVTNVNEPPVISGDDMPTFDENRIGRVGRYTARDPEGDPFTWSVSGSLRDNFAIDQNGHLSFVTTPDFESRDSYFVVLVAADDKNLPGSLDVTVTINNVDEPPVITWDNTIDEYDENGTSDVATYTAIDPEGDTNITWTLGGSDSGDFEISNSGVLTFKNVPDYERPADSGGNNHYDVTVYATDSTNKRGELHVDVIVQNVDEPPVITGPDAVDDFPENSAVSRQVARYTSSDPEGATVTLSLSSGAADFNLANNGVVTFKASPDHEDQSSYSFTVRAVAGAHTVNRPVSVSIQNLEEPGTVTLSSVQPQENIQLTATLEDDDGPTSTTWQWYRTSSRGSTGTELTGETSASYTPVGDDVGFYLRATASYDDGFDNGNTATAASANRVAAVNPDNVRPEFDPNGDYVRAIRENLTPATLALRSGPQTPTAATV